MTPYKNWCEMIIFANNFFKLIFFTKKRLLSKTVINGREDYARYYVLNEMAKLLALELLK